MINTKLVEINSYKYFRYLAICKYILNDVALSPYFNKREEQIVVSTWHGTPLKTLGYDFIEDSSVIGNQQWTFSMSDYIVFPNKYTYNKIINAYKLNYLFNGKALLSGYPRNSILFSNNYQNLRKRYGDNKQIIVYMPTYRGKAIKVNNNVLSHNLNTYLHEIDELLNNEQVLYVKLHRLNQSSIDFSLFKHIKLYPGEVEIYKFLSFTDCLITDYSSIIFDFACTRKKIILFPFDEESYIRGRGIYMSLDELPFPKVYSTSKLVEEINLCEVSNYNDFVNEYCAYESINNVDRLINHIFENKQVLEEVEVDTIKKDRVIVFCGELEESYVTDSLFLHLKNMYKENKEIFISYMHHLFINRPRKLEQFSKEFNQIPMFKYYGNYVNMTLSEHNLINKIHKKNLNINNLPIRKVELIKNMFEREFSRFMYNNNYDTFIRLAGLDITSLNWLCIFSGKKIIYVQNNMIEHSKIDSHFKKHLINAINLSNIVNCYCENDKQWIYDNCKLKNVDIVTY